MIGQGSIKIVNSMVNSSGLAGSYNMRSVSPDGTQKAIEPNHSSSYSGHALKAESLIVSNPQMKVNI